MRYLPLLLAAAAIALIAGCTTPDDGESTDSDGMMNESTNETTSIAMDFPSAGPGPFAAGGDAFDAPENASAILVEAEWECTSPTCEITITVLDENGTEVGTGSGTGSATVAIDDPGAGTYTIEFSSEAPVVDVTGEARVTVFTGPVPDGFTAWEDEGGNETLST